MSYVHLLFEDIIIIVIWYPLSCKIFWFHSLISRVVAFLAASNCPHSKVKPFIASEHILPCLADTTPVWWASLSLSLSLADPRVLRTSGVIGGDHPWLGDWQGRGWQRAAWRGWHLWQLSQLAKWGVAAGGGNWNPSNSYIGVNRVIPVVLISSLQHSLIACLAHVCSWDQMLFTILPNLSFIIPEVWQGLADILRMDSPRNC